MNREDEFKAYMIRCRDRLINTQIHNVLVFPDKEIMLENNKDLRYRAIYYLSEKPKIYK